MLISQNKHRDVMYIYHGVSFSQMLVVSCFDVHSDCGYLCVSRVMAVLERSN